MSVGRRIIDGAKSGLNSLLDRVAADDTPLSGIERDELDAELSRRVEARKAAPATSPEENPRARWAGAGEESARRRREAAEAREKRIRGARAEKKKAEDAARDAAWRKLQEDARRAGAAAGTGTRPPPSSSSSSSSSSTGGGGPRMPLRRDDKIAKYYKALDLPYGADFEQVKAAYRKLIRKYHPDLHGSTPQKQKAANELTVQVTQAYNELEIYLKKQST
ncbi:MAG TPA: J domain-containing protein [Kofleriaceae bacterium]|jgi:DnaJ-domain-containing protein 1